MRSSARARLGWMISAGCAALAVVALVVWTSQRERGEPVEAPAAQCDARNGAAADADRDREEIPIVADAPESEPEDEAPQAPPPTPESDWLLHRAHGPPETSEQRLQKLTELKERYQTLDGIEQLHCAYGAATYAVATILDHQGRTEPAGTGRVVGPDEWEIGTLGANYVFPKTEFVAYTDVQTLYASAIGSPGARDPDVPDPPPPTLSAELEASLDALVGRAIDLLTKKQ